MLIRPIGLFWWVSVVTAVTIAMGKDRSPLFWLALALVGGPLAAAVLLCLPSTGHYSAIILEPEAMELCDVCEEPVRRNRDECRYCGHPSKMATIRR